MYTDLITIVVTLLAITLYWMPSFIAGRRQHKQVIPIVLLNLLLGWMPIFWILMLAYSLRAESVPAPVHHLRRRLRA